MTGRGRPKRGNGIYAPGVLTGNERFNSHVVIDARFPYERLDSFPKVAQTSPELAVEVRAKFPDVFS